jgi:competence protein ComEA
VFPFRNPKLRLQSQYHCIFQKRGQNGNYTVDQLAFLLIIRAMFEKLKQLQWQTLLFGMLGGLLATALLLLLNQRPTGASIQLLPPPATITPVPVRVYMQGEVKTPGVYALPKGSILQAALDAAGGLTDKADTHSLNLAQLLNDGDQVVVPALPPTRAPTSTTGPGTPTATPASTSEPTAEATGLAPGTLINLNTATLAELDSLPHIGPTIAQRIIDYRTAHGPFTSLQQVMNVEGIGPGTYQQIKDFITVK